MALDPNIPLMARGIQMPDRMNMLAQFGQLQAQQQQRQENMLRNRLLTSQMEDAERQRAASAAQLERRNEFLRSMAPTRAIDANRVSGITGPRPEALNVVGQRQPMEPANALLAGFSIEDVQKLAGMGDWGRSKVARTVEQRGPDGRPVTTQLDEFGRPVGANMPKWVAPVIENLGGHSLAIDPTAVQHGQQFQRTQTPDSIASNATTIRGQNLTDARAREGNDIKRTEVSMGGKPPPGYRWAGDGRLEAIPGGPGDKLPERQQNQVIGTQNLSNAIKEYRAELANFKKMDALSPDARAAMGTKYNNMMLQAKEAYNLGVLNGPDLDILTSVITDPRSFTGAFTSNSALDTQASELDRIMGGIASVSANRRPQDARPGSVQPAAGGVINFSDLK